MGDSPARIRAYVRTRTRTHAGHASRHKIDPPDRRLATISVVELRQIVFMKVNRCSSLAVIVATRSFARVTASIRDNHPVTSLYRRYISLLTNRNIRIF